MRYDNYQNRNVFVLKSICNTFLDKRDRKKVAKWKEYTYTNRKWGDSLVSMQMTWHILDEDASDIRYCSREHKMENM